MRYLTWALSMVPVVLLFAAAGISHMTYDAPEGNNNGHLGTLPPGYAKPDNVPTWIGATGVDAEGFKDCTSEIGGTIRINGRMVWPNRLLVVDQDRKVFRLPIDEAFERIENDSWADDIWVVGSCR